MQSIFRYIICTVLSSLAISQQLDIATLEKLVIEGNPDLFTSEKQIDIEKGRLEQSKRLPNPVMVFESGAGKEPESVGMLSQKILLGGKKKLAIKLSDLELRKAQLEHEILKQTKLTESLNEFVVILHLQDYKTLQQNRISAAEDLLNAVGRKVEAGKLSPAEKSRARIQLIQEQLELRNINKSLKAAWNSISALWGEEKPSFNQAADDISFMDVFLTPISLDNAPEIQIYRLSLEILETKVRSEKAHAVPDLEIGAGLKRGEIPGNTYQIELSIPLPVFNKNKGNIKSAVSELDQAQMRLRAAETRLRTDASNLQSELESLASEAVILDRDIIPEAQSAYTTITEGYLNGRFTYLDVIDAKEMWFKSREQYLNVLKRYYQDIFQLNKLTGNTAHSYFMEKN